MAKAKTYIADVYTEGKTQLIKLPKAFHIDDGQVYIRQADENKNIIEVSKKKKTLQEFLESTPGLSDDFIITRDGKPPRDVDVSGW